MRLIQAHHFGEHPTGYFNCGLGYKRAWDVDEVPPEFRHLVPAEALPFASWHTDQWLENRKKFREDMKAEQERKAAESPKEY